MPLAPNNVRAKEEGDRERDYPEGSEQFVGDKGVKAPENRHQRKKVGLRRKPGDSGRSARKRWDTTSSGGGAPVSNPIAR